MKTKKVNRRFRRIMEPCQIGQIKLRNRIIKTGAGMLMWHEDDIHMRENVKAYYERLARGGAGMIIVEAPIIDYPSGARYRNRFRMDDDRYIQGMSELVEVIHRHGCPAFMMMNHDGPWQAKWGADPVPIYSGQPVAASSIYYKNPYDHHNEEPRALTIPEIEVIIKKFVDAAERAKKAGFDGVDINASCSHLFNSFLSRFWNKRDDMYGGSIENRARIVIKIIREIKRRLGQFPVSVLINGLEMGAVAGINESETLTVKEAVEIARLLQEAGADMIQVRSNWLGYHVAGFLPETFFYPEAPIPASKIPKEYNSSGKGAGANIYLAESIRKAVTVPVAVVGRIDPKLGEKILRKGMADIIGMTRRLNADPELPEKVADGRLADIAPCTACDYCLGSMGRCRINSLMGNDFNTIEKAVKKKKILVIGGGPAGMEAARISAIRGHDVTLAERSGSIGGLLPVAAVVKGPHPEEVPLIVNYFKRQLKNLNVSVKTGVNADSEYIKKMKPDTVIFAGGGLPTIPDIPGIDLPIVVSGPKLYKMLKFFLRFFSPYTLRFFTKFFMPVGRNVVIIGGGIQGCELGEFLTKRGRKVTIVEKSGEMGTGMTMIMHDYLLRWFGVKKVELINNVKEYVRITKEGLTIVEENGNTRLLKADTIIPALPLTPETSLVDDIKKIVTEVSTAGDCNEPLYIAGSIAAGMNAARTI